VCSAPRFTNTRCRSARAALQFLLRNIIHSLHATKKSYLGGSGGDQLTTELADKLVSDGCCKLIVFAGGSLREFRLGIQLVGWVGLQGSVARTWGSHRRSVICFFRGGLGCDECFCWMLVCFNRCLTLHKCVLSNDRPNSNTLQTIYPPPPHLEQQHGGSFEHSQVQSTSRVKGCRCEHYC
jgi:hypothetical protein